MLIRATITINIEPSKQIQPASLIDDWIAKIKALDERELTTVAAILEARDMSSDLMRRLFGLLPALLNPGKALAAAYERSRAELLQTTYQLATLRDFLTGRLPNPESLSRFVAQLYQEPANGNVDKESSDGVIEVEVKDEPETPKGGLKN